MKLLRLILEWSVNDWEYFTDSYYDSDGNTGKNIKQAKKDIQSVINFVLNLKYPLRVYRGIDEKKTLEDYDNNSWSLTPLIAKSFGTKIYTGLIPNEEIVDLEQTIRTRILMGDFGGHLSEDEIYVKDGEWRNIKIEAFE